MKISKTLLIIIYVFIIPSELVLSKNKIDGNNNFKLIFWEGNVNKIEELKRVSYIKLINKYNIRQVITDDYFIKYYWDEQLIEIDYKKFVNYTGKHSLGAGDFFSIVVNNEVMYSGIVRIMEPVMPRKYSESNYPDIINYPVIKIIPCANPEHVILAIKPNYQHSGSILRDYPEREQQKLFVPEVLKYFEEQDKIVRGKIDIDKLFRVPHKWGHIKPEEMTN